MIKLVLLTIITFIILIIIILLFLLLLMKTNKIKEKFEINKNYIILRDNGAEIRPILWYKFDKDNLNKDEINEENNLSYNSAIYSVDFVKGSNSLGGSLYFDGTTYAQIPVHNINLNSINNLNGITITFWVKLNPTSGFSARIFNFGLKCRNNIAEGSRSIYIGKHLDTNDLIFGISSSDASYPETQNQKTWKTSNYNYFNGNWFNITWTISNTGIWNIYINNYGVLINFNGGKIESFDSDSLKFYYLGKSLYNSHGLLNGNLDDFRIYNRVISLTNITELYSQSESIGKEIITNGICRINNNPTGPIKQIPDTNIGIKSITPITEEPKGSENHITYKQAFINFNNEIFTMYFSQIYSSDFSPIKLFNKNNFDDFLSFKLANYDVNGNYKGNVYFNNISNIIERGDFIRIKLPNQVILKRYGFKIVSNWVSRAPGTWSIYIRDYNTNQFIQLLSNTNRLTTNNYCEANLYTFTHDIERNKIMSDEYLFIFTGLARGSVEKKVENPLCISELLLFIESR